MQNLEWVVPVVIMAIWFITHLLKNNEEERAIQQRRRQGNRPARQEGASPVVLTEIDRFLSEVNRRRQQTQEKQATSRQRQAPQRQTKAQNPRPSTQRLKVHDVPPRAFPTTETMTPSLVAPQTAVPVLEALPAGAELSAQAQGRIAQVAKAPARPQPDTTAEDLLAMLGSPQSLRTALLIQEVLGRPRSMEYFRRHASRKASD